MSEILEKVRKGARGIAPAFRVRCTCGRVYVTNAHPNQLRRQRGCLRCMTAARPRGWHGYFEPKKALRPRGLVKAGA